MSKVIDQYIDSGSGQFFYVVEDNHGVISQHAVSIGDDTPDLESAMQQTLAERDARTAKIDLVAQKANIPVRKQK